SLSRRSAGDPVFTKLHHGSVEADCPGRARAETGCCPEGTQPHGEHLRAGTEYLAGTSPSVGRAPEFEGPAYCGAGIRLFKSRSVGGPPRPWGGSHSGVHLSVVIAGRHPAS